MVHKLALLAPFAIVAATACGSEAPLTAEEEVESADEVGDVPSTGQAVTGEETGTSQEELRRGGTFRRPVRIPAWRGGSLRHGAAWHGGYVARGGAFVHRGWVGGRWAPGWGWVGGRWVVGGGMQIACVVDQDCIARLGTGIAVCSYDPTFRAGYCVGPSW